MTAVAVDTRTTSLSPVIPTAPSTSVKTPSRIAVNRSAVIDFAKRMVATGEVTVTSPMHRDLVEHRLAIHDPERTGYTVIFISVTDGVPETTTMNFDLDESIASRHVVHEDGLGLTLVDARNRPLVDYRIG